MSVPPLPAATWDELRVHVLTAGQPVNVSATGFGNVPDEGVTVMSYFADDPTVIVGGPELLMEKLNAPVCAVTARGMIVFAVSEPDAPVTVIGYAPAGVPTVVATVRNTSVTPLPAATIALSNEHVAAAGQPVNDRATGFGNVPADGVIVMSYFPEDPAAIVAGPELLIEKLNALFCTVSGSTAVAFTDPEVPVTVGE